VWHVSRMGQAAGGGGGCWSLVSNLSENSKRGEERGGFDCQKLLNSSVGGVNKGDYYPPP